jgi:transketolase
MGIDHFGASAPGNEVFDKFGFTVDGVLENAKRLMSGK